MRLSVRLRCVVIGVALCAVAGATGCQVKSAIVGGGDDIPRRGHAIFQDQTCVRTDTYEVASADTPMDLCIRIGLKSGSVGWQILGPDGQSARGSGDATANGAYHVTYCIDAVPGDWQFVLDMKQASGECEIAWYEPGSAPAVVTHLPKLGD